MARARKKYPDGEKKPEQPPLEEGKASAADKEADQAEGTNKKKNRVPKQLGLDGKPVESICATNLDGTDYKRAAKVLQKLHATAVAAKDELGDILAGGCKAPVSVEKAMQYIDQAIEKIKAAQTKVRGAEV